MEVCNYRNDRNARVVGFCVDYLIETDNYYVEK